MKRSNIFNKFKDLLVVGKIMDEVERSIDIRDKVLAEFVLDLAKRSKTVMDFETQLEDNGAEFSIELISTLYALITKMLPENFKRKPQNFKLLDQEDAFFDKPSGFEETKNEDEKKIKLTNQFPSLAMKNNVNKEEIDLFDESSQNKSHSRKRSHSSSSDDHRRNKRGHRTETTRHRSRRS
jgi:ATP-dependent RNA helicase DHX8/PRP22